MTEPAVGIDLGTTFSVIAWIDGDGRPRTIPNSEGDLTTPSVVYVDGQTVVVGKEAVKVAVHEPDSVADFAKRDMGNSVYHRSLGGKQYPPQAIQSFILEKLRRDAINVIGDFRKAVVTVPAFFNDARRKATREAAALAGIEVLELINEPTAASLMQGIREGFLNAAGESPKPETVLVYDLGGGTFDVTIMKIDGGRFETIASDGEMHLGGFDWDGRIIDWIAERFREEHRGVDPRTDPRTAARLRRDAEDAKRTLSTLEKARIVLEHGGSSLSTVLTRSEFENMTSDLLDRTHRAMCRVKTAALRKMTGIEKPADKPWKQVVSRILLVGGSTRMVAVSRMIEAETGIVPDRSLSADEAVAHGAAIYADLLLKGKRDQVVRNASTHSIGVLAKDREGILRNQIIIPRNSSLPARFSRQFRMPSSGQVTMTVLEGESPDPKHCTVLHRRPLIPSHRLSDRSPVEVVLDLSHDGCIRGEIQFKETDERLKLFLKPNRS